MGAHIRLSQCMIVKNEEKNIERALSWGKKAAFEQIVVDTGSTDKTVEIAERMGATVYHFTWIDDFSAAKNFATEKASGNWIAFLDADEYFTEPDTIKLIEMLHQLEKKDRARKILIIACGLANIDDSGIISSLGVQTRIFRNVRELRFHNRIHEEIQLNCKNNIPGYDATEFITIQHTGYSDTAYMETNKLERNIRLLRKELDENPQNEQAMEYLAESLLSDKKEKEAEAILENLLNRVKQGRTIFRQESAFFCLMNLLVERNQTDEALKIESLYHCFKATDSNYPDMDYRMGIWKAQHGKWKETIFYLEQALEKQKIYVSPNQVYMLSDLEYVYYALATAYQKLNDNVNAVRYCTLALRSEPYSERVLISLLSMLFLDSNTTVHNIIAFLEKLYPLEQLKAKLFIYKCAKKLTFLELEDYIYHSFSDEERSWFEKKRPETISSLRN